MPLKLKLIWIWIIICQNDIEGYQLIQLIRDFHTVRAYHRRGALSERTTGAAHCQSVPQARRTVRAYHRRGALSERTTGAVHCQSVPPAHWQRVPQTHKAYRRHTIRAYCRNANALLDLIASSVHRQNHNFFMMDAHCIWIVFNDLSSIKYVHSKIGIKPIWLHDRLKSWFLEANWIYLKLH